MNKYVIISDSSIDISKDLRKQFGIEDPIPGKVIFGDGRIEDADYDWERMTPEQYFNVEMKKNIKTSLPNQYEIVSRLEPFFQNGQDILAIVLSSGISGTYSAFVKAGEELMEKYPGRKMITVDTLRYSSAIGLLCIYASLKRNEGKSIEDNAAWCEENKRCIHQAGILDDLKFLARNGKITGFKAFMGTMVGVKPIADFSNESGQPAPLGNVRGFKKAYKVIAEYIRRTAGETKNKCYIVEHSMRPEQAEDLKKLLETNFQPVSIFMTRCGQTNGSAIGPGLATIFYLADTPISPNAEAEVAIFKDIVANL